MYRITPFMAVVALSCALAATVLFERQQVHAERGKTAAVALESANFAAEHDSTRIVAGVLADSLRLAERQVVQIAQRGDSLDRALERERIAKYATRTVIDTLHVAALAAVNVDTSDQIRRADFHVRHEPYTVTAHVELPSAPDTPDTARIELGVALDTIPIEARVSCSSPNASGIRSASIDAVSPSWAQVSFRQLSQSPDLCASPALVNAAAQRRRFQIDKLILGAGRVATPQGWGWGLFLGTGIILWI